MNLFIIMQNDMPIEAKSDEYAAKARIKQLQNNEEKINRQYLQMKTYYHYKEVPLK